MYLSITISMNIFIEVVSPMGSMELHAPGTNDGPCIGEDYWAEHELVNHHRRLHT